MKQYIVDAFTDKVFSGNPAAICVLDKWLPDETMISIAKENNLSETAFAVKEREYYHLRWFTPGGEIDLCGHATLACAYVLMRFYEKSDSVVFHTLSGELRVVKNNELFKMEFPAYELKPVSITNEIIEAIGSEPKEAYIGRDLLCVFNDESVIRNMKPDLEKVKQLDGLLLQVTAPGKDFDCVSRSFAPKCKVNEDPVCGSGHCHIVPYWADKLKKHTITAYQASERSGILHCRMENGKVILGGNAVLFSASELFPDSIKQGEE